MRHVVSIVSIILFATPVSAQSRDAELKRISDMARRCREESNKFREAGGRAGDPGDPALKWSAFFWQYGQEHAGSPAGVQATVHGLSWLMFASQDQEVIAKAQLLPLDFPLWGSIIEKLRLSCATTSNYSAFRDITRRLLEQSKDNKLRAAVQLGLGRVYQEQRHPEKARAAFQAALREAPDTPLAEEAELLLNEMQNLQVGQPVPAFEAQTIDGKRISSAELRGKVVLLTIWATW